MSGNINSGKNNTEQIRIGRDLVMRHCRDKYSDELAELVKWHHGFVMPRQLSWLAETRESRIPQDLTWSIWQGQATEEQQKEYLALIAAYRERCRKAQRVIFCDTSYSKLIWHTCEVALYHTRRGKGTQCHIRGDAGCGKTLVARAWHQTNNHGRTIFCDPKGAGGSRALLEGLALLLGVDRNCSFSKLITRVFSSFEPGMVLVVDEVSLLVREGAAKQPMLDLLRRICDITGASLITLATDDKFEGDLATSAWNDKQWWRRMTRITDLPSQSPDPKKDITALFEFKFPQFELGETLLEVFLLINSDEKGGFGQVAKIFDDAEVEAAMEERKVALKDVALCAEKKIEALESINRRSRTGRRR
jgi:AAA domain